MIMIDSYFFSIDTVLLIVLQEMRLIISLKSKPLMKNLQFYANNNYVFKVSSQ